MMLQPPPGMGDQNAVRRQQMMALLLRGVPPQAAQPNPGAHAMSQGLQSAMRDPGVQKWIEMVAPRIGGLFGGPATAALPIDPGAGGQMPGLY